MILSKKVRLYPSELQEQKLLQSVGTARFIYIGHFQNKKRIIKMVESLYQIEFLEKN